MLNYARAELKQSAKTRLNGNWGLNIVVVLFVVAIPAVVLGIVDGVLQLCAALTSEVGSDGGAALISLLSSLVNLGATILFLGPLTVAYNWFSLVFMRGQTPDYVYPYRTAFSEVNYMRFMLTYFMMQLFIFLWSLLFIIPGIVKSFSYAMTPFILMDHPEMEWKEAITESRRLMDGHKGDLFVLYLSFIPWLLLTCLTMGILLIYVTPYMQMTVANFYRGLKEEDIGVTRALPNQTM